MNTLHHNASRRFGGLWALTLAPGLTACDGMPERDKNTVIGAGVSAVSASMLTGCCAIGSQIEE
jgi:hypothetical protein